MAEIKIGAYRDKLEDTRKALEGAGISFHDVDLLVPRLENWAGSLEEFKDELAAIDGLDLSLVKKSLFKQWKRTERQLRFVAAPWGTAGGKKKFFDGYARGAVPLGDYIENLIFGLSSDSDVYALISPILRRFQDLPWGSWHERDVNRPAVFPIQAQPSINSGKGSGPEGMEPPLQEEEHGAAEVQKVAKTQNNPKGKKK